MDEGPDNAPDGAPDDSFEPESEGSEPISSNDPKPDGEQ